MSALNTKKQRKNSFKDKKEEPSFKVGDYIIHKDDPELGPEKIVFILPSGDLVCVGVSDKEERIIRGKYFYIYKIYTPPPPKGKLFIPIYRRIDKSYHQLPYFCGSGRDSIKEIKEIKRKLSSEYELIAIKELEFTEGEGLDLLK